MQNPTSEIHQFVAEVLAFSTEFGTDNWSASKIRGPPSNLNVYGDCVNAWCPSRYNEDEFLEVKYDRAVYATKFKIYENLNGGSLIRIEAYNGSAYETLWFRDRAEHVTQYNIFSPNFHKSNVRSNQYRFTFRCNAANYYSEVDAIELVGVLTNIKICEKTLTSDMTSLIEDKRYADLEIHFNKDSDSLHAHKCILAIRCQKLHDDLLANNNLVSEINREQFSVVLDFLYTDKLSVAKVQHAIEVDKAKEAVLIDHVDSIFSRDQWMLCLNKIMRFTVKYRLRRLESLILDYLLTQFFNVDNVLNVLVDASRGDFSTSDQDLALYEAAKGDIKLKSIRLNNVEFVCLEFIRCNLQNIVGTQKVEQLPKDVLISVLKSVAL